MKSATPVVINDGNVVTESVLDNGPVNGSLHKSNGADSAVLHRSLLSNPLTVVKAKGNYLHLANGQAIFDATGGAAVASIGHGNEAVRKAVADQMDVVSYCHSLFFGTDAVEGLAKFLIESTNGVMSRAFFVSSGSEANEAALKFARQYHLEKQPPEPERCHFIARQQSYHGTTLGSLAVGGHVARRGIFEPLLALNSSRVSPCYEYRGLKAGQTPAEYVRFLEAELDAEFQRIGPNKVAAFIAEPVVGAALGCVPSVPGYFEAVRRVCDRYGALLILDEVMCGVGRSGPEPTEQYPHPLHAWQDPSVNVVPDIMTLGKGLGGGYMPVAAMMLKKEVVAVLQRGSGAFSHGQTYQGHPLACAAGLAVQQTIRSEDLVANVRNKGKLLEKLLREKIGGHPSVGDIRGRGLFWGVEFVADKATKQPFPAEAGVAMGLHELGMHEPFNMSIYPGNGSVDGKLGDHVLLSPAYNVTAADIEHITSTFAAVVREYFGNKERLLA